jgi:hypothetical protein
MPKRALTALGVLVRKKRGNRRLREVAREIGITAPTLMLGVDSGDFLGSPARAGAHSNELAEPAMRVSAHFKADQLPLPETANALARMLLFLAQRQAVSTLTVEDGDA